MKVLAIETSCDETAVAVVEGSSEKNSYSFEVLAEGLNSQIELHKEFDGVYPTVAKREHIRNLVPIVASVLEQAGTPKQEKPFDISKENHEMLAGWFSHEPELTEQVIELAKMFDPSQLDGIAVTHGPGLEPALWVGVNVARALALLWNKPLVPTNHMEGHFLSGFYPGGEIKYPVLGLLVSGGHTELVLSREPFEFEVIGATRDDASGEAFDKGARLLGLPYPGGAEISKLAAIHRETNPEYKDQFDFPRPMMNSNDLDFSYSGLKTALLYQIRDLEAASKDIEALKHALAREYEDAILDVLLKKTEKAIDSTGAATLVLAGGVSANQLLRNRIEMLGNELGVDVKIPPFKLSTDNAVMIGMAGSLRLQRGDIESDLGSIRAHGNLAF